MKAYIQNKKAYFDFEHIEKFEAGISLFGHEVKSIKGGRGSLVGSYIIIRGSEAFLVGADITAYQQKNTPKDYDSKRPRKLLLHAKEIVKLAGFEHEKGLTIIPLSLYNKGGKIKVEIAIARGKKLYDKRETIKKRESKRDILRTLKEQR